MKVLFYLLIAFLKVLFRAIKPKKHKCANCAKCIGNRCTVVWWKPINELNLHGECGFYEPKND